MENHNLNLRENGLLKVKEFMQSEPSLTVEYLKTSMEVISFLFGEVISFNQQLYGITERYNALKNKTPKNKKIGPTENSVDDLLGML